MRGRQSLQPQGGATGRVVTQNSRVLLDHKFWGSWLTFRCGEGTDGAVEALLSFLRNGQLCG